MERDTSLGMVGYSGNADLLLRSALLIVFAQMPFIVLYLGLKVAPGGVLFIATGLGIMADFTVNGGQPRTTLCTKPPSVIIKTVFRIVHGIFASWVLLFTSILAWHMITATILMWGRVPASPVYAPHIVLLLGVLSSIILVVLGLAYMVRAITMWRWSLE